MNFDTAISFLSHSNWGFLVLWIVFLGIAFAACFPEKSVSSAQEGRTDRRRS